MNTKVHVTLRVPKDIHDEIMNTNEHSTKNAKYLSRLTSTNKGGEPVSQMNTDNKEILADIKAGVEAILDQLNG